MPYLREEIEQLLRATDGRMVQVGAETTVGHFIVEPQLELDDRVMADVPTLTVPQMVPGLRIGTALSVELTQEDLALIGRAGDPPGYTPFEIVLRAPATAPGETRLVLRSTDE